MRKNLVRIVSLALCMLFLGGALCGCTTLEKGDKGMEIGIYIADELYNFDPAQNFTDTAMEKVLSMLYEGLTTLDKDGKWQKAMMKNYTVKEVPEKNDYRLQIELNITKWTDGRTVQAADFVYAWKRLLDPEFKSESAALLYDIKNAKDAKLGYASIDDVGVKAIETYMIEISFDHKIDYDKFFTKLASVALSPLREDVVEKNATWAQKSNTIVTNGPFCIKSMIDPKGYDDDSEVLRIERSVYYYLEDGASALAKEPLDKYVIPYRLITNYEIGNIEKQLAAYEEGKLLYLGEIPVSAREKYQKEAVVSNELNTHSYFFNVNNELFKNEKVRQALSLAIDRTAIANKLVFADAATGLVPTGVFYTDRKTDFRKESGDLLATSADMAKAKSLLKEAGVKGGSFTLTVKDRDEDIAIAEMVIAAWKELGFKVTLNKLDWKQNKISDTSYVYNDEFSIAYATGDFDVIAVDYQLTAPDAFLALAPFAKEFSGNGVDMDSSDYPIYGHVTGFDSEKYNELIEKAFETKDEAERASILKEAEKLLMEELPVVPVVFTKDAYLINKSQLSGYKETYLGTRDFRRMKQKNYYKYKVDNGLLNEE